MKKIVVFILFTFIIFTACGNYSNTNEKNCCFYIVYFYNFYRLW